MQQKSAKKLWGGRFTNDTHPIVEKYTASISFDYPLAMEDILGSMAHANMLKHCNIITAEENDQLQQGLTRLAKKIAMNQVNFNIADEDIHMNIERLLYEEIGAVAGKLHTARSRNDQVALDIHLYLRKQIITTITLIRQLQQVLLQMAAQHNQVILPGYTHLQRAQPIYLAHHWLAYVSMLQRDIARLQDLWPRVNQSPLGACALAGTTLATDRNDVAIALGFESSYTNTLDAVSDRDFIVEFLAAGALIMTHISRLSEELILWSSQEFNFIEFDDAFCTGSSIMPQKKNPDVAELSRAKTGRVYGALLTVLTILKGLPLAYNKDLQEDKEPLFDVVKTVQQTLTVYPAMLSSIKINEKKMQQAAEEGYLNATAFAEFLVKNGMAFRTAHEITGKLVKFCINKKCKLEQLSLQEFQQFLPTLTDHIYQVLNIKNITASCDAALNKEFIIHKNNMEKTNAWLSEKVSLEIGKNQKNP